MTRHSRTLSIEKSKPDEHGMALIAEEQDKLLEEINRLQREKKSLNVRLQGVEVLAKVLQESQDENLKLRQEVSELKGELESTSVNISPSALSLQTTPSMAAEGRCFLSQSEDNSFSLSESSYEYVNYNPQEAPLTSGIPHCDLHIKELSSGFKTIKDESDVLLGEAKNLLELTGNVKNRNESANLASKVSTLVKRIGHHAKEVKTRETFLQGLANEEEQLKEKFMAMEMEQVSQEKVMEDLKVQLKDDKEEIESIREQIKLFGEAVFINKEETSSIEHYSSSETASNTSQMSSLSRLSSKDKELGELGTPHACGQCSELIRQLNQVKREKEEVIRQKEEILDVNHEWDAQYKKLKTETGKEIADLKHQINMVKESEMWKSASSIIEQERQMKQQALDEKNELEEKCRELQEKLNRLPIQKRYELQPEYTPLQQTPDPSSQLSFPSALISNQKLSTSSQSAASPEEPPQDMIKEIEVLKQQLRVYADDFACERQDRERMQNEKETLETEVRNLKEEVSVLREQVRLYEEDFKKESEEKDRLKRQLNFQREGSDPETRLSDMTRKAQAVAERQARLRALREQYNREQRHLMQDQQDLHQSARVIAIQSEPQNPLRGVYLPHQSWAYRQDIHPRGPSESQRSSNDMFHGGDVQADSRDLLGEEVVDGATNSKEYCCPRCFRLFPHDDEKSYKKHTMKCIE